MSPGPDTSTTDGGDPGPTVAPVGSSDATRDDVDTPATPDDDSVVDDEPASGATGASGSRPGRPSSSFVRDLSVTVTAFVVLVGGVATWLWIRDALDGRGDAVAAVAPTDAPAVTTSPTPPVGGGGRIGPPTAATSVPVEPVPSWVPVVEILDPGTSPVAARDRARAVTALGFPAVALPSERVRGVDAGVWVLVGDEQPDLDGALADCAGRSLLPTCEAHRLVD